MDVWVAGGSSAARILGFSGGCVQLEDEPGWKVRGATARASYQLWSLGCPPGAAQCPGGWTRCGLGGLHVPKRGTWPLQGPLQPSLWAGTVSLPPSPIGQRTAPIHAVVSGPVTLHESLGASLRTTHRTPKAASGEMGRRLRTAMRACLGTRQRQLCSVRWPKRASLGGFSSSCQAQEDCNLPIRMA